SRRIGRAPTLFPPSALADVPTQTSIIGATKLTGKVGSWSVGSLAALTARERSHVLILGPSTVRDTFLTAEPMAQYFAGRARRELSAGRWLVGGMLTAVHRDLGDTLAQKTLRSEALAGGVDFRHEFANRAWVVRGDAEGSRIA